MKTKLLLLAYGLMAAVLFPAISSADVCELESKLEDVGDYMESKIEDNLVVEDETGKVKGIDYDATINTEDMPSDLKEGISLSETPTEELPKAEGSSGMGVMLGGIGLIAATKEGNPAGIGLASFNFGSMIAVEILGELGMTSAETGIGLVLMVVNAAVEFSSYIKEVGKYEDNLRGLSQTYQRLIDSTRASLSHLKTLAVGSAHDIVAEDLKQAGHYLF